jgi:hypothetical protein
MQWCSSSPIPITRHFRAEQRNSHFGHDFGHILLNQLSNIQEQAKRKGRWRGANAGVGTPGPLRFAGDLAVVMNTHCRD